MCRLTVRTLEHLHNLSLRFHLERRTGAVSSDLQRGAGRLSTLLNYLVFSILPLTGRPSSGGVDRNQLGDTPDETVTASPPPRERRWRQRGRENQTCGDGLASLDTGRERGRP